MEGGVSPNADSSDGQFEFVEWTADGDLRHSRFMGLREDEEAATCEPGV